MISVDEALSLVLARSRPKRPRQTTLAAALGLVLAEDVVSDIDSPPHDKSLVDGYAVIAADLAQTPAELTVLEEVTAGNTPTQTLTPGSATRIMTGAPIPNGADAVVMVERTEMIEPSGDAEVVRIVDDNITSGRNIMRRATSLRRDETVLRAGCLLRPIEVGLLAEVGSAEVRVQPRPSVAVLSTGDELVPAREVPLAGQIRNSNGPMLNALVDRAGGRAVDLGIGRDTRDQLRQLVATGLEEDILVLSGGVSAGVLDLVPSVLESLGVKQVFHKVHLKPGKPVWFGVLPGETAASGDRLVFGLPGNPVSSLVCFELFVRPALAALAGRNAGGLSATRAALARAHDHRSDRPTFFPARLTETDGRDVVELLAWKGSADLRTLSGANCLAYFPPGEQRMAEHETVDVYLL